VSDQRTEYLTEGDPTTIRATGGEGRALQALGPRLAATARRNDEHEAEDAPDERTAIHCAARPHGRWEVQVNNAVGVVAVEGVQLVVEPKIPMDHFTFLLAAAGVGPRTAETRAQLRAGDSFWDLVARWFVSAAERVLRLDLIRDYQGARDDLQVIRGHVVPVTTATAFYRGRIAIDCEYEEFDIDNPLNRLLLAALRVVAASTAVDRGLRRSARRLQDRFDGVGDLQSGDAGAVVDIRTQYYKDAVALARHILYGQGRSVSGGGEVAWSFLFRTPTLVEAGVRKVLSEALSDNWYVSTDTRQLLPTRLRLQPDLVFDDGFAIADIKYKVSSKDWLRPDLYQVVTYATGYRTRRAALIAFRGKAQAVPSPVHVGDVEVHQFLWDTEAASPAAAGQRVAEDVARWLRDR
jgi:5-methylcytosine-specific restriction enzyme subunit McrC